MKLQIVPSQRSARLAALGAIACTAFIFAFFLDTEVTLWLWLKQRYRQLVCLSVPPTIVSSGMTAQVSFFMPELQTASPEACCTLTCVVGKCRSLFLPVVLTLTVCLVLISELSWRFCALCFAVPYSGYVWSSNADFCPLPPIFLWVAILRCMDKFHPTTSSSTVLWVLFCAYGK